MRFLSQLSIGFLFIVGSFAAAAAASDVNEPKNVPLCSPVTKSPDVAPDSHSPPRLVHSVTPQYPKEARHAKIQGAVKIRATIAPDGTLKDLKVLEGDSRLAKAALEAVSLWHYEPARVNDAAVEVPTDITVNFVLQGRRRFDIYTDSGEPVTKIGDGQSERGGTNVPIYEIGHEVKPPKPVFAPNPEYSKSARRAKIQGTITLGLMVTPEGLVGDIAVCKNLERSLDQKAIDTVRQWKFQPATKDDEPVAVRLNVEVSFRLY
jgi:TonB family protein